MFGKVGGGGSLRRGEMISVQFGVLNRAVSSSSLDCGLATDSAPQAKLTGKSRR